MFIFITILSIITFIKTITYGIYEIRQKNKSGGISIFAVAFIALILPNLMIFIVGL